MKGDSKVLQHLNRVLKNELTAINQYFLHSKILKNWGIDRLATKAHQESVEEMKHADTLAERILLLDGLPNFQDLGKLLIGEDVKDILECDMKLEQSAIADLKSAIVDCEAVGDFVSRELFANILADEEEHIDWVETQLDLVARIGLENYIQANLHTGP